MLSVAAVAALGISCGLNTGEKAPEQNPPSFSGKNYSCVGQIPQQVGRYAADELNEAQITEFVRCLQRSLTTFGQLTRGKDQESYAPEEIRRFLQTFFFRERPISAKLTHEFMVLKQVMVGGELDSISRAELTDLIEMLEDIRREAIRLKPHLKYLNPRLIANQDPNNVGTRLADANEALMASIRVVSARMQKGQREYPFANMEMLVSEFRDFVRWEENFPDAHPVRNWINFFKVFKGATVNPKTPEAIGAGEWSPFLQSLSRWYLAYIEYQVGVKNQPLLQGAGLHNTMHLAQELFTLTEEALKRQENETMPMAQLITIMTAAQDMRWIYPSIRVKSVESALNAAFDRMFADERANSHFRAGGLNAKALGLIKYEFYRWAAVQMQLATNFNAQARLHGLGKPRVPNLQNNVFIPLDVRAKLRNVRDADWDHFLKVKSLTRPLFNDNLTRVTLVQSEDLPRFKLVHEFHNLSMMNLFRSAVGVVFRGYSADARRQMDWAAGVKSEEAQKFYEDVRDLMVDLTWADRRNKNVGSRAFIEGNLFTYSADGLNADPAKSRLSFVESMELLAFLYSGSKASTDIYFRLLEVCRHGGGLDQNGDPKVDRSCVSQRLSGLILDYGLNMPGLHEFMRQAPVAERDLLVKNLIDSSFSPKNSDTLWVERNEVSIMAVVMHYMEAVLTRFDANRDGALNNKEIEKAVPVFAGFIQSFAKEKLKKDLSVKQASDVFIYILAYKQIPSSWNMFWFWSTPTMNLNRAELSTVFRVIVAKIFETAPVQEQIQLMATPPPAPCQPGYDTQDLANLSCLGMPSP